MNLPLKLPFVHAWTRVAGVQADRDGLCYLIVKRAGSGITVQKAGRIAFGDAGDEAEGMAGALPVLMKQHPAFKKTRLVLGLNESDCTIKQQRYPDLKKSDLEQGMLLELRQETGASQEAPLVLGYAAGGPARGAPGNTEYLCVGIPEEAVNRFVDPFSSLDMTPAKVSLRLLALRNLMRFLPAPPLPEEAVGLLHVGNASSLLVILKNGQVDFFRDITMGVDDFSKSITSTIFHEGRAIQFTCEEAVKFRNRYGYPIRSDERRTYKGAPLSELGAMMRPVMERLTGEIQRSLGFYGDKSGGVNVANLYLIGVGAALRHLDEALDSKINAAVSRFPAPHNVTVAGGDQNHEIFRQKFHEQAVCFALAAETDMQCNLLPQVHRQRNLMKTVRGAGVAAGMALIGLAAAMFVGDTRKISQLEKNVHIERALAMKAETAEKRFARAYSTRNMLDEKIHGIHAKIAQDDDIIGALKMLTHIVPTDLRITDFQYVHQVKAPEPVKTQPRNRQKQAPADAPPPAAPVIDRYILVAGMSREPKSDVKIKVGRILLQLQQSGHFSRVELLQETGATQGGEYRFDIKATLGGAS